MVTAFKGDFRQLDALDIAKQGKALLGKIPQTAVPGTDAEDMKKVINLLKTQDPKLGKLIETILALFFGPTPTDLKKPNNVPVGLTPSSSGKFTMAVGLQGAAFAVIGATASAGVYGSTSPELGVFFSLGGGWWTNVGLSAGISLTFIFGPPADLNGVSWGIGCDSRWWVGSVGGLLLFSPPPFRFLGFSVGLSAGPSMIPAFDVTVQVSNTFVTPILQ